MNVFEDYIKSGRITTKEELKRYFWILAKNVHPDIANIEKAEKRFIKLKDDFEEAAKSFPIKREMNSKNYNRIMMRDAFQEIVARGFPIDIELRDRVKAYKKCLDEYSVIINNIDKYKGFTFKDVEDELYEIRGTSIINNSIFGTIKMIFYNVVSYYYLPTKFTKNAVHKFYDEINERIEANGFFTVRKYLSWLIKDLESI